MKPDANDPTLSILERIEKRPGYSTTLSAEEFAVFEGLEASGFLFGQIGPDAHDAPDTMVEGVKLTATGRQYLRELRSHESSTGTSPNLSLLKPPLGPGRSDLFPISAPTDTYTLLDTIWEHYRSKGEWLTTWFVHSQLGKPHVMSARSHLNSNHLIENPSAHGPIYQLQICGVLLTQRGRQLEGLLLAYLDFLRERYNTVPGQRNVTSAEVQKSIGLSPEETHTLGLLVFIAGLFGAGSQGATSWSALVPTEIEDFLPEMSSRDFLRQLLAKRMVPLAIGLHGHQRQLFTSSAGSFLPAPTMPTFSERLYQVFVSSTFTDLKDERHEVMMALLQTKCIPVGMERFPAADADQMAFIKPVIDNSDYYIVILAGRYGTVPDGQSVSYTEMEFDYAVSKGKYVIVMCHRDIEQIPVSRSEKTDLGRERLQRFYDKVRNGRLCDFWTTPHELGSKVKTAIYNAIEQNPQPGWVRATSIASASERKAPLQVSPSSMAPKSSTKIIPISLKFNYTAKGITDENGKPLQQTIEFEIKRSIDDILLILGYRFEKGGTTSSLKGSFDRLLVPSLKNEIEWDHGVTIDNAGPCYVRHAAFQLIIDTLHAENLLVRREAARRDKDQSARWLISRTGAKRLSQLRSKGHGA